MAELAARRPLAGRAELRRGALVLAARSDLCAYLLTAGGLDAVEGAIRLGPRDWLLVEEAGRQNGAARLADCAGARAALVQDMTAGSAFLELSGPGALALLGVAALARQPDGAFTTRIAGLRVTVQHADGGSSRVRLVVERPSADYLWEWLAERMALEALDEAG